MKKEWYAAGSSLYERFQTWNKAGVWKNIYRMMVKYYHKKRHLWVDQRGAPLSIQITAANAHDVTEIINW